MALGRTAQVGLLRLVAARVPVPHEGRIDVLRVDSVLGADVKVYSVGGSGSEGVVAGERGADSGAARAFDGGASHDFGFGAGAGAVASMSGWERMASCEPGPDK